MKLHIHRYRWRRLHGAGAGHFYLGWCEREGCRGTKRVWVRSGYESRRQRKAEWPQRLKAMQVPPSPPPSPPPRPGG